jgi:ribosomal protein S27AE
MNPFDGKPGFFNKLNRIVYSFMGPAHVGTGRTEEPDVVLPDPRCPLCGQLMASHTIDRSGERTQLHCPT